MHTFPVVTL